MSNELTAFDYSSLTTTIQQEVRAAAERIKVRIRKTAEDIVEIGKDLKLTKDRLGHGKFLVWIDQEFRMSDQTARNFMKVAEKFGDQIQNYLGFSPTALIAMATASPEVIEQVETKLASGEKVDLAEIKRLKEALAQKDTIISAATANERRLIGEKGVLEEQTKSLTKAIADARDSAALNKVQNPEPPQGEDHSRIRAYDLGARPG